MTVVELKVESPSQSSSLVPVFSRVAVPLKVEPFTRSPGVVKVTSPLKVVPDSKTKFAVPVRVKAWAVEPV